MDEEPIPPRPAECKTVADGRGGLIKVTFVGESHDGHVLYIDELDLPDELWTSGRGHPFEWWPPGVREVMAQTALGSDPDAPPVRYRLRIPDDTRRPLYVSDVEAR